MRQLIITAPYSREFENLVLVTGRLPQNYLYRALASRPEDMQEAGIKSLHRVGDCLVPSSIADAVYRGHKLAREADAIVETITARELPVAFLEDVSNG